MTNFRIFTNFKSDVSDLISAARINPKESMKKARGRVNFKVFDDWRQVAHQSLIVSPYSFFWRSLALQYPETLLLKELPLFFESLESRPLLREQAVALIFKVAAKKLPKVENIQNLPAKSKEQVRVRQLLVKKKNWVMKSFIKIFSIKL